MIQCPDCRSLIPDDSAFCDQCGKELKWCPKCRRPKHGTECPLCGSDLVPGRKYLSGRMSGEAAAPDPVRGFATHPSQPGGWAPPSNDAEGGTPLGGSTSPDIFSQPTVAHSPAGPAALVGNGWRLQLRPGGFGRLGGIWPELGTCQYVSGNHGIIRRGPDGWEMTDAGSTNGTYVNGQRLATGSPVVLKKGDSVRIATLDFIVE